MRALAMSGLLAGCASTGLLSYRPDDPLTATLPLSLSGVRDERLPFAVLFGRELKAASPQARIEDWLHGVTAADAADASWLRALDGRFAARAGHTSVLLVPGLFGDCVDDQSVPFGDGVPRPREEQREGAYAGYADLGLAGLRLVPLPGRMSSAHNGALLASAIRAEAARPGVDRIVLVAYSKGVPDALVALRELAPSGRLDLRLDLVSVAGAVMGTPLADYFQPLYDAVSPRVEPFGCSASDGEELAALTRRERLRWMNEQRPVTGPGYHSVVAYAEGEEVGLLLQPSHALLRRMDPRNDGQVLAADAVLPGSALLAAARSDHWDLALPRDRHPNALMRGLSSGRAYPREALFRALIRWVVGGPW